MIDDELVEMEPETHTVATEFISFCATNGRWLSSEVLIQPFARPNDGQIDLVWAEKGILKTELIKMFWNILDEGKLIKHPLVKYAQVKEFTLYPVDNKGKITVDGEIIPSDGALNVRILPSLARFIVPAGVI